MGRFYRFYSHRYFELSGANDDSVDRWMTVIAASSLRMSEERQIDDLPNYQESLTQYLRERLAASL